MRRASSDGSKPARSGGGQVATVALIGTVVMLAGFLAGQAIGGGEKSGGDPTPQGIATQQVSIEVPTLGDAKRIPALDLPEPPTEAPPVGESPEGTPEAAAPEPTYEPAPPAPAPEPEPAPEVTIAPSG